MSRARSRSSFARVALLAVLIGSPTMIGPAAPALAAAPQTTILSGPTGLVPSRTVLFRFKSSAKGSTFQCKLDADNWSKCTSPMKYTQLSQGAHTFRVRAKKRRVVDRTPAIRAFTVDSIKPETTVDFAPPQRLIGAGQFEFSSNETGTFECRLQTTAVFAPCVSAFIPELIPDTIYTFQVRARDMAGNRDATPATHQFARIAQMPFNQEIGDEAAAYLFPDEVTADIPSSCGGSPAIDCPGGTAAAPSDQLHMTATRSVIRVNGASRYDVTATLDVETLAPVPVTVPLVGDCFLEVDTTPGASPTVSAQFPMNLVTHSETQERYLSVGSITLTGLTTDDVALTGGFACAFANLGLSFFIGTLTNTLGDLFAQVGPLCMAPGPALFERCPWAP